MGNLFQELKRRNVFRVGAAYTIVVWVLIQVAESLLSALQMPDWTVSFVVVLLILGVPIMLIVAWAFDLAPAIIRVDTSSQSAAGSSHLYHAWYTVVSRGFSSGGPVCLRAVPRLLRVKCPRKTVCSSYTLVETIL